MSLGKYNSPESREAYARALAEHFHGSASRAKSKNLTINEIMLPFVKHVEGYYRRPDGTATSEVDGFRTALRPLRELYGSTLADEFGPLALKTVRSKFVTLGWSRTTVNKQTGRIRQMFRWAASEELVCVETHTALMTVAGLAAGRTVARESEPITPVAAADVEAILPHVNRHVQGIIRFQQLTGGRPGEAVTVRMADIDKSESIWFFCPPVHKTSWRGQQRSIAIGPKCQTMLAEYDTGDPTDYLFSSARAVEEQQAERSANLKTPRYPSHMKRNEDKRTENPTRPPEQHCTNHSYRRAVERACKLAKVKPWSPNQLRHAYATKLRKLFGLEAAQVMLGHKHADVTQIYAEKNDKVVGSLAEQMG